MSGWIPTCDEWPSKADYYLITYREKGTPPNNVGIDIVYLHHNYWDCDRDVIAWMDLPKPYREQEENDEA